MIEGHGDDLYRYDGKVKYNFSTNIVSDMDHRKLTGYLTTVMSSIGSYPEPAPFSLEKMIAKKIGVEPDNVVVTNGATDAMYRIAHIKSGKRAAIRIPTFREYQDACVAYGHEIAFFNDIDDVPVADSVWLCNPNNPTGEVLDKCEILHLSNDRDSSWIIVDQAYADYTQLPVITPAEAVESGNMILLSSLTKRFAVPGLRIGYLVAPREIAAEIRSAGMPWAVNSLAIEAGKYLLDHEADYHIDAETLHAEALRIAEEFRKSGINCEPTDCNFILCRLSGRKASDLKKYLVENHEILIRDASNFEGLDESYFRVAAQTVEQNDLLIKAIGKWMRI